MNNKNQPEQTGLINKLLTLFNEKKELVMYIIFGVLTTAISYIVFIAADILLPDSVSVTVPTVISWVAGVLFSYFTNKKWVFETTDQGFMANIKEFFSFVASRLFSGIVDIGIMWVFVDKLLFNTYIVKIISNVIVVVLNYILSKLLVFRNKQSS